MIWFRPALLINRNHPFLGFGKH